MACKDDSNQPIIILDLARPILERLSFVDFHRARCISSGWYSASESCIGVKNRKTPWIILFPSEYVGSYNDLCKLHDPYEKKTYYVRDLGFDLSRSRCLASSGSWFLMLDHRFEFHFLNLFARVRIPLPSLEPTNVGDIGTCNAVLWVDEESKDYLVVWNIASVFAYHKKGDNDDNNSWKVFEPLKNRGCVDMVFKERKLYVLGATLRVTVFYFSGNDSPVECANFLFLRRYDYPYLENCHYKLAVTLSGEVWIIVDQLKQYPASTVYKLDPKSSGWKMIKSLEGESLILELGLTVKMKVMRNCIYFSNDQFRRYNKNRLCNDYYNKGIRIYHMRSGIVAPSV